MTPSKPDHWIRLPETNTHRNSTGSASAQQEAAEAKDEPLDPKSLPEGDPDSEIESLIIPAVKDLHTEFIQSFEKEKGHAA